MGKIRIISDGDANTTKILMPDGTPIACVQKVEWSIEASGTAVVRLTMLGIAVQVDVVGEGVIEGVGPC